MAAAPAAVNNSNGTIVNAATPPAKPTTLTASLGYRTDKQPKSQRGLNKPKCKQCGNVARSRANEYCWGQQYPEDSNRSCPFESCKSCCSRNQNPCHIHVLKANSTTPDKSPSSSAAPLEQRSSEPSPSLNAGRVASLQQLSNSFAQFNNLHVSLRSRKTIARKDAAIINKWRFSKLKEYIGVENDAFDRYMQNVALLEEVLFVESPEDNASSALVSNPTSMRNNKMTVQWLKLLLRSNLTRSDSVRNRTRQIVDEGLQKLQKCAVRGEAEEPNEASKRPKTLRTERLSDISDLIDKINKARGGGDLKACLEKKSQLFNLDKGSSKPEVVEEETHMKQVVEGDLAAAKELDYSFPKLVVAIEIDQETLNTIHTHFCSLEHVEQL